MSLLIVTVARLDPGKGQRFALEAVEQLRSEGIDVRYVAAGNGSLLKELKDLVRSKGLLDTAVSLPGTLGEQEVLAPLRRATAFTLPSHGTFEAYPISVMEAMACGVPVVASRIGALPENDREREGRLPCAKGGREGAYRRLCVVCVWTLACGSASQLERGQRRWLRSTCRRRRRAWRSSLNGGKYHPPPNSLQATQKMPAAVPGTRGPGHLCSIY